MHALARSGPLPQECNGGSTATVHRGRQNQPKKIKTFHVVAVKAFSCIQQLPSLCIVLIYFCTKTKDAAEGKHELCIVFTPSVRQNLYTHWSECSCKNAYPNSQISPRSLQIFKSPTQLSHFIFLFDFFRRLWRDLLDDLAGVYARAPDVWGRGANAQHPRGSQFRPSDGHGDRSLRVAHGQRQPAHLAIDTSGRHPQNMAFDIKSS